MIIIYTYVSLLFGKWDITGEKTLKNVEENDRIPSAMCIWRIISAPNNGDAFDAVTAAIESDEIRFRLFFVDGPGGTGKSFLFNTMISHVKGLSGKEVLAVASSGVASLLLIGGRTAHSTFVNVPIPILDDSTRRINLQSTIAYTMKNGSTDYLG